MEVFPFENGIVNIKFSSFAPPMRLSLKFKVRNLSKIDFIFKYHKKQLFDTIRRNFGQVFHELSMQKDFKIS